MKRSNVQRWHRDPVSFIEEVLRDPETRQPFRLYEEQRTFLRHAFQFTPDGRMVHTELCYSGPKKSGKTGFAAMIAIYTAIALAPASGGEIYCLANDLEQSQSRVFKAVVQILEASPMLRDSVIITASKVTIRSTGTTIIALANDYAGFAGSNPTLNVYDESAYFTSEASRRLWDEGVPSPARQISFRLSVSTAGFEGEESPLRALYQRATKGVEIAPELYEDRNLLAFWSHRSDLAPWQSQGWIGEMRATLRPAQFERLILNRWVSSDSVFIPMNEWDACTDPNATALFRDKNLNVFAAIDASTKHDSTALALVGWDRAKEKLKLINLKTFQPSPDQPLDFESTIEWTVLDWKKRYHLRSVHVDPWQLASTAQRLRRAGVTVIEYAQSLPNLSAMAGNLFELVRSRTLSLYPDENLRRACAQAIVSESARGWKISKQTQSHKIDALISLAMAALAAVEGRGVATPAVLLDFWTWEKLTPSSYNGIPVGDILASTLPPKPKPEPTGQTKYREGILIRS
jgi:phage terminase large subunit-like protein